MSESTPSDHPSMPEPGNAVPDNPVPLTAEVPDVATRTDLPAPTGAPADPIDEMLAAYESRSLMTEIDDLGDGDLGDENGVNGEHADSELADSDTSAGDKSAHEPDADLDDEDDDDGPVTFADLGLSDDLLAAVTELGYVIPTPIQAESIPPLLDGFDLLGQAATGTGKTAAFALPMLDRVAGAKRSKLPFGLVLVPTRELANQVAEAMKEYGAQGKVRMAALFGGTNIGPQFSLLNSGVDIVIGTPGRVLDHLKRSSLDLSNCGMVVLDEADEMLDMGFAEDLEAILDAAPPERQTILFSATMPNRIDSIATRQLSDPVRISIKRATDTEGTTPKVTQRAYLTHRSHRASALGRILDMESPEAAIVFCRTRGDVDELTDVMNGRGYRAEALHGGMSQDQRDKAMGRLKSGVATLSSATDVAARGTDVDPLSHVVNYHIPQTTEAYTHRIGRVGRAG
ncbi:MAG: DEAD/DEAH box helicase, partial [Ilumatobacter sp.]|nr:DEAD/DEAH box helicase [Ilumatobacter sp.]